MKKLSALALTALTALSTIAAPAAQARNVDNAHVELARAVLSTGVTLTINPITCASVPALGWYSPANREMVVCQESAKGTYEVNWTEEDLDTLRHEAQHLVQDCMNGELDGDLGSLYQDPIALAKSILSENQIGNIIKTYTEQGASEHILIMELEAFSVAAMNNPMEQVADIAKYCF